MPDHEERRSPHEHERRIDRLLGMVEGQGARLGVVAEQTTQLVAQTGEMQRVQAVMTERLDRVTDVVFDGNGDDSLVECVRELRQTVGHVEQHLERQAKAAAADITGRWQFKVAALTATVTLLGAVAVALLK